MRTVESGGQLGVLRSQEESGWGLGSDRDGKGAKEGSRGHAEDAREDPGQATEPGGARSKAAFASERLHGCVRAWPSPSLKASHLEVTWPNQRWGQTTPPPHSSPRPGSAPAEARWELACEFCLAVNIIFLFPFSLPCGVSPPLPSF